MHMPITRSVWVALVAALVGTVSLTGQQRTSRGITSQDLLDGLKDPSRWLMYSGDYTGQRHSPLTQLTPENVRRLIPQWIFQTDQPPGGRGLEGVPLVLDGVIYFTGNNNTAWALDARTGRPFWAYRRQFPSGRSTRAVNRGFGLLDDRLFLGTLDAHLMALDMKTGSVIWDVVLADHTKGYAFTSAPLVINNKVIVGPGTGERNRGFIAAYDAQTGKQVWRFWATPEPGEPGSETWPNAEAMAVGGGAAWVIGSYDRELNLIYWGTGNAVPVYDLDDEVRKGDNLHTASIVALDADTGKLRWYYQFTPHDTYDWDAAQVPVLADLVVDGQPRKVVMQANRNGFFYVLDRTNGKLLQAKPFVDSDWAREIGPNGQPIVLENGTAKCIPESHGATNFFPPSYDPTRGLFFVTAHETCMMYNPLKTGGADARLGNWTVGGIGYAALRALDPKTGTLRWEFRFPPGDLATKLRNAAGIGLSGGITSTASGLVFTGDNEGNFIAFDADTGKNLWHYQVGAPVWGSAPTTFMLDGRQHVLIAAGVSLIDFALPDTSRP